MYKFCIVWVFLQFLTFCKAFGSLGHYVIGEVVQRTLSEQTKKNMEQCKFLEPFEGSMGNASLWADQIKGNPRYRWTSAFHYYDIDNNPPEYCGVFVPPPNPRSVNLYNGVGRALRNSTQCKTEKSCCGSKFHNGMLLHLLQDYHQPLHLVGKARGGNEVWFERGGKKYNLHRFWDSDCLEMLMRDVKDNYTRDDAVDYFWASLNNETFPELNCPKRNKEGSEENVNLLMKYIFSKGQEILNNNCELVWQTQREDYLDASKGHVQKLLQDSVRMLNCVLEFLYN